MAGRFAILEGHVLDVLRTMPSGLAQCVMTSPPYWGLRDYGTAEWDGGNDPACDHVPVVKSRSSRPQGKLHGGHRNIAAADTAARRENVCSRCGAMRMEPTVWDAADYCEHRWLLDGGEIEPARGNTHAGFNERYFGKEASAGAKQDVDSRPKRRVVGTCVDCGAWRGQLGHEATPEMFVSHLADVFDEVRRVLRDDGLVFVNLGDSYASSGSPIPGVKPKDLVGVPWMFAFEMRRRGWFLRSEIVWAKPNPMPESVTSRPTKAHEVVFMFAKSERYFYDDVAVREDATKWGTAAHLAHGKGNGSHGNHQRASGWMPKVKIPGGWATGPGSHEQLEHDRTSAEYHEATIAAGRSLRDVWWIPTEGYAEAHFATYPRRLVEPVVLAGTSAKGQCEACGRPWARETAIRDRGAGEMAEVATVAWVAQCGCAAGVVPQVVLDPFSGSGTTGVVAMLHDREYIGIELSAEFAAMARRRITEQGVGVKRSYDDDGNVLAEQEVLW